MENRIYDEKNGLWYELQGDYYLPCLELPEQESKPIGIWGQRHLRYIKQYKRIFYTNLLFVFRIIFQYCVSCCATSGKKIKNYAIAF